MRNFLNEFKAFASRGNVLDLAVGVVIGSAFTAIVNALVEFIIMPIVGIVTGGNKISALAVEVGDAELRYGAFLQAIVDFLIIAFVVFIFVRLINTSLNRFKEEEKAAEPVPTAEDYLREIRDLLAAEKVVDVQDETTPE